MNEGASTNEEFYARLGIDPPVKARGIRQVMADDARRAQENQDLLTRLDATAIKTSARAFKI